MVKNTFFVFLKRFCLKVLNLTSSWKNSMTTLRIKFAPWFEVADSFNKLGMDVLSSHNVDLNIEQQKFVSILYARTLSQFQAILVLTERGLIVEARTIVRSAAEALFLLVALTKDATICDLLHGAHYISETKRFNGILSELSKNKALFELDIAETNLVIEKLKNQSKKNMHSTDVLAKMTGLTTLYETIFRSTSGDATHATLGLINQHIVRDRDGNERLIFNVDDTELRDTLYNTMNVLKFATEETIAFFHIAGFDNELQQYTSNLEGLGCPRD